VASEVNDGYSVAQADNRRDGLFDVKGRRKIAAKAQ